VLKLKNYWQNTMKRDYTDGVKENITFFTGVEIEKTPAFGMKTLFVVGIQKVEEIISLAELYKCQHIYFGANQSYSPESTDEMFVWDHMIMECLTEGYWCTLDFDAQWVEDVLEGSMVEQRRFIPQVSVKLPYLTQLGYNATIKIDDKDFDATNPGVWCHRLRDLTTTDSFTSWDEYSKDIIIK
jgi:hypothetical protein